jgi:two-component system heavy metal sensor histidine kinase CusS
MRRSIRVRLLFWVIGGMAVLQVGFAALVYEVMEDALQDSFDAVTAATARTLSGAVEQDEGRVSAEIDERDLPEFRRARRPDYYQMWLDDGEVLARSSSLRRGDLQRVDGQNGLLNHRRMHLPDGRKGRAAVVQFAPRVEHQGDRTLPRRVTLVVARDTASLDAEMEILTWLLSLATGGTIAVSFLLGALIVRQGLKPLDTLATRIASIRQGDLSARVTVDRMPTELAPVVQRLNDLLQRLEEAFGRERAFTSDAAHELRTPLAGLRSTIEVALARPRQSAEYRDAFSECLTIVQHTQALISHLLALARMEGHQTTVVSESVLLAELVETVWRPLEDTVARRGLTVHLDVASAVCCTVDRALLQMVLAELATNAVEYTDDRGRIDVTAVHVGRAVDLQIANSGCRLVPEDATHVFERFWRGDESRSQTGVHAGLGLTLVQQAVSMIGGSVAVSISNGTFLVRLSLPSQSPDGVMS